MALQHQSPDREVLAGLVERVTYHNVENGFCVVRVKARGHRELVTLVGHAATISAGEWITATGGWVNDRTHGQQFKAQFLKTSAPSSVEGIASGMIRGIGPVYAKRLLRAFGEKVFDVIEAEPDRRDRTWAGVMMPIRSGSEISRGSIYYLPRPVPKTELAIMHRLDRLHLEYPFAGSRMLRGLLAAEGCKIGRRHVRTLMRRMGIEALYRRPRTTTPEPGHKIYPYLLRGIEITRPNQVGSLIPAEVPLIDAEILFKESRPPLIFGTAGKTRGHLANRKAQISPPLLPSRGASCEPA
jgi:hypothetical protein